MLASVFLMGVPVNPMKDAFGSASRRLLAKPQDILPFLSFALPPHLGISNEYATADEPS